MHLFERFKNHVLSKKRQFAGNSLDSLLAIVDTVPSLFGFSIRGEKISVPFWLIHFALLFYIYGVGSFVFQWKLAENTGDYVKSYFNVSILALVSNNSWWFLKKRSLLKSVMKDIDLSEQMARSSGLFDLKHKRLMKIIKKIILIFYGCNFVAIFVYWPNRIDINTSYSTALCVGMKPLTVSPNKEVCLTFLALQEITITSVTLNFQTLLLLLIAHTSIMYQMLVSEMTFLDDNGDNPEIKAMAKDTLPTIIRRHSLILQVIVKLQSLYTVPLGVNFGSNAVCMSLFFYLPINEWFEFLPIVIYCFLVFFLYCFLCQRLIDASEEFERAVHCCGWENFGVKEQKLIYVMLRQSQKPIQILAAGIIPVNIYTFATTLQGMFKFVTVVKV